MRCFRRWRLPPASPPRCSRTGLRRRRPWLAFAAIGCLAIPAVLLMVKHLAPTAAASIVPTCLAPSPNGSGRRGTDGRDIYVFNYDPLVYSYADAVPPTRFVLGIELADFDMSSGAMPLREVDRILQRMPDWIVLAEPSPYAFSPDVWDRSTRPCAAIGWTEHGRSRTTSSRRSRSGCIGDRRADQMSGLRAGRGSANTKQGSKIGSDN